MQISNKTSQGCHYTVSGGGGTPTTPILGTFQTGYLQPGAEQEVTVTGRGPWKVQFVPEQDNRVIIVAHNPKDCVSLVERNGGFDPDDDPLAPVREPRPPAPRGPRTSAVAVCESGTSRATK